MGAGAATAAATTWSTPEAGARLRAREPEPGAWARCLGLRTWVRCLSQMPGHRVGPLGPAPLHDAGIPLESATARARSDQAVLRTAGRHVGADAWHPAQPARLAHEHPAAAPDWHRRPACPLMTGNGANGPPAAAQRRALQARTCRREGPSARAQRCPETAAPDDSCPMQRLRGQKPGRRATGQAMSAEKMGAKMATETGATDRRAGTPPHDDLQPAGPVQVPAATSPSRAFYGPVGLHTSAQLGASPARPASARHCRRAAAERCRCSQLHATAA